MLRQINISGFKSFARKTIIDVNSPIVAVVGPNGSGKSNIVEAIRFAIGEQSLKSIRSAKAQDLIWHGSNQLPRVNRASVSLTFDNTSHLFDIDFDTLVIQRQIYRDGTNEYLINGSKVRLKDVVSTLASANVGVSKHSIISQGETDKLVLATPKQRFSMIEDALGLRVYHMKKKESQAKLEKTQQYMTQTQIAQAELKPRLDFLERQMKKKQKLQELQSQLLDLAQEYISNEQAIISSLREQLNQLSNPSEKINQIKAQIQKLESMQKQLANQKPSTEHNSKLKSIEEKLASLNAKRNNLLTQIGELRAQIKFQSSSVQSSIPADKLARILKNLTLEAKSALASYNITQVTNALEHIVVELDKLSNTLSGKQENPESANKHSGVLNQISEIQKNLDLLQNQISELEKEKETLFAQSLSDESKSKDITIEIANLNTELTKLTARLAERERLKKALNSKTAALQQQAQELIVLLGHKARNLLDEEQKEPTQQDKHINQDKQEKLRMQLERIKLQIEQIGTIDPALESEYETVKSRFEFYSNELEDLKEAIASINKVIAQIEEQLQSKFKEGVSLINEQFSNFFGLLFSGGQAKIEIKPIEEEQQEHTQQELGAFIKLKLPRKKLMNLSALSGGEKSLTAIALIFAMTQVSPPPFLILDETDAALDELNARRYANMLKILSKKTQLITITHNRETMLAAGTIYGVTTAQDGASRILAVSFDKALEHAS